MPPLIEQPIAGQAAADVRDRWRLRLVLAACQAAAIGLTWNLWQARSGTETPPNLPLIEWLSPGRPQFGCGWLLLASLALVVLAPRIGVWLHAASLVLAIALDQFRIQREFVSVAILLTGTVARRGPLTVARCHLISLWAFAGLHKLLSPEYWTDTGPYLAGMLLPRLAGQAAVAAGLAIAAAELLTGLLAVFPLTRRVVPWLAAALHAGILLSLLASQWNTAVWPWNVALIAAACGYFRGWDGPLFGRQTAPPAEPVPTTTSARPLTQASPVVHWAWQIAAVAALLHPALYYVNACDAYLAWCDYSSNTPEGTYFTAADLAGEQVPTDWQLLVGGDEMLFSQYESLNVPFPPSPRVYRQFLLRAGQPGDAIVVADRRPWSRWLGRSKLLLVHEPGGTVAERPVP
jgi:hypothetical protein